MAKHTKRTVQTGAAGQAANFENVTGGAGNDTITGNAAANTLTGGGGNDILLGNAGNDSLQGDAGRDILIGDSRSDTLQDCLFASFNDLVADRNNGGAEIVTTV